MKSDPTLFRRRSNPVGSYFAVAAVALALVCGPAVAGPKDDGKTVLCFVSHKTSHGFGAHEYAPGCRLIGQWLAEVYPEAKIEARYSINWPEKPEEFFKDADSVIFFCSGGGGHLVNGKVAELDKVMRTGAGLACLHYAVEVPIGPSAKGMLAWMGGYFEMNWSVNPHWKPEFKVFPDHPAARGVKPFVVDDEWYFHMRFVDGMQGVTPILSAIAPDETMKRPDGPHSGNPAVREAVAKREPQHVAWAYERGEDYARGRGYGFTGLHYHWNWEDDNFRKTVLNGVAWTAQLAIPEGGIETPRPTRELLEANILEHAGDQGRDKKAAGAKPAAPQGDAGAKPLFESAVVRANTPGRAVEIAVDLPAGAKDLYLVVGDAGDGFAFDWSNWMEPRLVMADGSEKKLSEMDWKSAETEWGRVSRVNNAGGGEMKVDGKKPAHGIGVHANSVIHYALPAGAKRFLAKGGLDDGGAGQQGGKAPSSVKFLVFDQAPGAYLAKAKAAGAPAGGGGHDPADAVANLEVHPELEARLFASEPMVLSPSAIDVDERGRVWVCEVVNYRRHLGERREGDRILILEDKDGDGKADGSTVFHQGTDIDSAHGIAVLGQRVIVSAGEEIFSLYDDNGDGKSDRKEMLFTKIGGKQHDHGIHAVHFGPDGRLYFNFGNAGQRLCDAAGNEITDINGVKCTTSNNRPHQQGLVFRCEPDGSKVEMLGWNFRNNWEVAVDAYGTVWQSDNDDDGNQGVRINYVMEYGNYGYTDEMTGAGWREPRIGIEPEIPRQHWRLNDPGVVPNLLQTGQGSPTGIVVYEGDALPAVFRGQVIHCDAGPSVVRAYPVKKDGAGYSAETVNILEGTRNRWFRPSDVSVAPDGSLIVADWYDPGVGGHAMGDLERGRIFQVVAKGQAPRKTGADLKLDTVEGALAGLKSPNESARYLAWTALHGMGKKAEPALKALSADGAANPRHRARALWLLARIDAAHAVAALEDADANLRITAFRAIRQLAGSDAGAVLAAGAKLAKDSEPQVRREVALALRHREGAEADALWAQLAGQADAGDRWMIEALGIGAEFHWAARLKAAADLKGPLAERILWRSRAPETAAKLAELVIGGKADPTPLLRSLDFQPAEGTRDAAFRTIFEKGPAETALYAAGKIGPDGIARLEGGPARLDALLAPIRGTAEFVNLADKLNLTGFPDELVAFVAAKPDAAESVTAARLLLRSNRGKLTECLRDAADVPRATALARAVGRTGERDAGGLFAAELNRKETAAPLKIEMVNAMAMNGSTGRELLKLAREGQLDETLKPVAALAIARSPDAGLRNEGAGVLPVPKAAGAENFPPLADLVKMKGDAGKGADLFAKATCATCHRVKGQGIDFGPDLSQVGGKLSREGMFEAILYPNAAISHGFHGIGVTKKDGAALVGYATGETDQSLQLRLPGGVDQSVPKTDIAKRDDLPMSLMPPGLAAVIGAQGLVDLVTWLETLK
jgi:putative membrane-bound dehydrogenase-like protein